MKKATFFTLILFLSLSLWGQQQIRQLFQDVELTSQEQQAIREIIAESQEIISRAQVEMNFYKAQLERLLFDIDVDESEVEGVMRESLQWRLRFEMARLRRRIRIRRLLGDQRWALVVNRFQELERQGQGTFSPNN